MERSRQRQQYIPTVFAILGSVKKIDENPDIGLAMIEVANPFVYALLISKSLDQYSRVLEAVKLTAASYNIVFHNFRIMTDFLSRFKEFYVSGRPGRGRRRPVPPRFAIFLWNQYDAALSGSHKTNNVSEGWHNRFRLVVGRNHPELYSLLKELKKDQADSESMLAELSLGKAVKAEPKKKWVTHQNSIRFIVHQYEEYKNTNNIMEYLENLGSYIHIT